MSQQVAMQRLESLIESYQPRVYRAACMVLRDPVAAEDVAQDTFLRAYAAMPRIDASTDLGPWLCRISINLCLNRIRSRRREQSALDRMGREQASLIETSAEFDGDKSALDEALRRLPDRLRIPVILRYYLDFSEAETGKLLSIRTGTIKSRLHQARRLLSEDASVLAARTER
ncbi:MAG: RNA polymerase sigma factor [Actinomycetota bacterium]